MIHILGEQNSIFNTFMAQVRDKSVQADSMRFRRNLERLGEIMSYEISKQLNYAPHTVETPLGELALNLIDDKIVLATVLRAGLPLHQGFLNYFDNAQCAFVAAYRKNEKNGKFTVKVEYVSSCDLTGKVLLLIDPMRLCCRSAVHLCILTLHRSLPASRVWSMRSSICRRRALRCGLVPLMPNLPRRPILCQDLVMQAIWHSERSCRISS